MSEEDAALFWEIDNHPTPDLGDGSIGPALADGAIPVTEETVPETTMSITPVPSDRPEDPRCTGVCARPAGDSQDTKPADSARLAHVQERARAPVDDSVVSRPPHLQATISTQTDETTPPQIETLEESELPVTLKETVIPGPMQPESHKTQCKGWRMAHIETRDRLEPEFDNPWTTLPFAEATWRLTYRVRAVTSADDVDPRVQEVLHLPVLNLAAEDPHLVFIKELLQEHDVRPPWNVVREESVEVKILWTQFRPLRVQENVLYRRRKEAAADPRWQVVAPKPLRSQIFKACHHHAMAAHQGVVRTAALIKRRFYWPRMQKDVEAWCKRCTTCGCCKAAVRGHGKLQQPRHGAFNKRVSVDLIGSLHRTDHGNKYIVVMQDHFTKLIEGAAVATKEAMLVADVIVNEWVYKHDTPLNLHSDRGTEFTAAMHRCLCDLLRIHKMYSTAYNPQSNGAVERCNRTLLFMLRTVVSEQQND